MKVLALLILYLFPLGYGIITPQNWLIQAEYSIAFDGSGAEGTFDEFTAAIQFDPDAVENANFAVEIKTASINTGNTTQDKHARGDSWFDAEKYPLITFQSTDVIKNGANNFQMKGELNMHGITKVISFPFSFKQNTNEGIFSGKFIIDRTDYGINGPFMAFMVGDEFEVIISVPVKRQ